jgi:hypothetical protein
MNLRKNLMLGCCVLTLTAFAIACSQNTGSEASTTNTTATDNNSTNENTTNSNGNEDAASTIYGKVTGVDGNNITLALGEMAGRNMEGGAMPSGAPQDGTRPSAAPEGFSPNDGTAPSGAPEDFPSNNGAAPSGTPQNGDDTKKDQGGMPEGRGNFFTENGETSTITIDDESIIKVQSRNEQSSGSLEDITVDSILAIEYADDGSISSILVQGNNKMPA